MFIFAHIEEMPVLGMPGCVMYGKNNVSDLLLPHILARAKITHQDITMLALPFI